MTNLFELTHTDGTKVVVRERNGKFRILAGVGGNFFHVATKPTLKGAIGFAKRSK